MAKEKWSLEEKKFIVLDLSQTRDSKNAKKSNKVCDSIFMYTDDYQ
jgi:hypothetical protein